MPMWVLAVFAVASLQQLTKLTRSSTIESYVFLVLKALVALLFDASTLLKYVAESP